MGAAASCEEEKLNEEQVKTLCGEEFDQAKFDAVKDADGFVTKAQLLEAVTAKSSDVAPAPTEEAPAATEAETPAADAPAAEAAPNDEAAPAATEEAAPTEEAAATTEAPAAEAAAADAPSADAPAPSE